MTQTAPHRPTLVLSGTGKTGRRLVERLTRRHIPVRIGSRSAGLPFDREQASTGRPVFQDAEAAYTHVPDVAVSNPADAIAGVVETALAAGTRRLVLLSGRGEEKAGACEEILMSSGADWTILRASSFNQTSSEGHLLDPVLAGRVMLPAGDVGEPFSDTDDTAYTRIPPEDLTAGLAADGVPSDTIDTLGDLIGTVLDGRNAEAADGVERVLERPARDVADYARATGVWAPTDQPNPGGP